MTSRRTGMNKTFYIRHEMIRLLGRTVSEYKSAGFSTTGLKSRIVNEGIALSCHEHAMRRNPLNYNVKERPKKKKVKIKKYKRKFKIDRNLPRPPPPPIKDVGDLFPK